MKQEQKFFDVINGFFLKGHKLKWDATPDSQKGKMFNYICSIAMKKNPQAVTECIKKSEQLGLGFDFLQMRAMALNQLRPIICENAYNLNRIHWFAFPPKKPKFKSYDKELLSFVFIGRPIEMKEFLKYPFTEEKNEWVESHRKEFKKAKKWI